MRPVLACALAALAVLLAGCGGKSSTTTTGSTTTTAADNGIASQTPDEIIKSMQAAVKQAKSVHIIGAGATGGTSIALNLKLVTGKGGAGHVALGGLGFDIVRVGNKVYIKASKKFLVHYAGSAGELLAGRWFTVSKSVQGLGSLEPFTDLPKLMNQILSAASGTLTKGSPTTVDGQPAIPITDSANGGTLYVATTGPAYPLKLVPSKGKGTGAIRFTDWDQPVSLAAPKGAISFP
jgi:hypothetical protein